MKKQLLFISIIAIGSFMLLSMTSNKILRNDPWTVPAKYKKMKNPYLNTADKEKIGRIMYAKHCKSCHGTKGKGDGKKAASLDTSTGDFTDASFKDQTDGSLYYKTFNVLYLNTANSIQLIEDGLIGNKNSIKRSCVGYNED